MRTVFVALLLTLVAAPAAAQDAFGCPYNERMALDSRPSPLDSVVFSLGDAEVKLCYGRPSARGRTMIGGEHVPYGQVWRTGANESTKINAPVPLRIAGMDVPAGTYSIYTVPGETEWQVIVNRAYGQWGHERNYTEEVREQEVGRASVPVERLDDHVEQFTIRAERHMDDAAHLVFLWEHTKIEFPVTLQSHEHRGDHH